MEESTIEAADGAPLASVKGGRSPVELVLLHAGVADRRSWLPVMERLAARWGSLAYDRPGFGGTPAATAPYRAVDHLDAVVAATGDRPVVLIGNSMGGGIAIDYALGRPDRVRALVLVASAVSGSDAIDWEEELGGELVAEIEAAERAGDLAAVGRYEARIWLDGPRSPEGRVSGPRRELFLDMNGRALHSGGQAPEIAPPPAMARVAELAVPVLVVTGALDVAGVDRRCRAIARAVPRGRLVEFPDAAHLPALEHPERFADAVASFLEELDPPGRVQSPGFGRSS